MSQQRNTSKKFNIKEFLFKHRFFLIFLVFNVFVHRKILLFDTQLAYGDFSPFPESVGQAAKKFFFAWDEKQFGYFRAVGVLEAVYQMVILFVLRSPLVSQKFYILLLPMLGYLSFNYFAKHSIKFKQSLQRDVFTFLISTFYAFSPISLGEFLGGSLYTTMLIFALFPILYSNTLKLLEKPTARKIFIHGLLLGIFISIYLHTVVIYFITLIIPFIYDLFKKKFKAIKTWFNMVYSSLIAFFLNPILFFTSLNILQNTDAGEAKKSFTGSLAQFAHEVKATYIAGRLFPTLRIGSFGFNYYEEHVWTYPFYIITAFVLLLTAYKLFIKKDNSKILLISFLNFLFISSFIFFTHLGWTSFIFIKIPVLFMFRNPSKLTYINSFFFFVMFYYTLGFLYSFKVNYVVKHSILSLLVTIQFVYVWPIFLGDRGLSLQRVEKYNIPNHFFDALSYMNEARDNPYHRSTWMPVGHEATYIKLVWLDRTKLDAQIGIKEFGGSAFEHDVIETAYSALLQNDKTAFINSFKLSLVDYLVLLKEDYYYAKNNYSVELFENVLEEIPLAKSTEKHNIYRIGSKTPHIYSPSSLTTSNIADAGNYFILSKADTSNIQTLVPLDTVNQFQIPSVENNAFLFSQGTPKLTTNVEWQSQWVWNNPAIYPNIPDFPTRDTETATYLEESMVALAEISEYLNSQNSISQSEIQKLLDSYSTILGIYINFVQGIPPERLDNNTKTYLTKLYLYVERSLENLRQANLVTPTIQSQYEGFYKSFEHMTSSECEYDYCFNFGIGKPTGYEIEIYDLNEESLNNSFYINEKPFPLEGRTISKKWTKVSDVYFEPGNYQTGINLNLENKPRTFDEYTNSIIVPNDYLHKYKNTFIYSFDEDVFLTLTYTPESREEGQQDYIVWKGILANTKNSNFCYKKIDGKCYRLFLSQLQPTAYKDTRFTFDKEVSLEKSGTNEIRDFEVVELKYPTLYLKESTQNVQEKTELNPPDIEFEKINPTKYKIRIKNITEDFMLVFNQSYNTKWILQDSNKQRIADNRHFKVNYFANAWWIKTSDLANATETELDLIFYPQRFVWLSLASTIITLSISIYIIYIRKPIRASDKIK